MNILHKILVYITFNKCIVLPIKYYEIIKKDISDFVIISSEESLIFKKIGIFNWENFSKEYKLKCFDANRIIIFSDKLKPTFVLPKEIKKNDLMCCICLDLNVWFETKCCKQPLHKYCFTCWEKSCPFCRCDKYKIEEIKIF